METVLKKNRFRKVLRYGLFALLAMIIVMALVPNGPATFRKWVWSWLPEPVPRVVDLPANPAIMGKIHGEKMKYSILLLEQLYIKNIIGQNDYSGSRKKAATLFDLINPRWKVEVSALATASGADVQALMLGNSFLDLGITGTGCRQVLAARADGSVLHAHNLDWDNLGGIGNYIVTIFRTAGTPKRLATTYMAFPGMIGALDVINSQGVAMSFNQVGFSKGYSQMPVFLKMREIAETCHTFEAAEAELLNVPEGMPFCIGLSDAKSGKIAVFERNRRGEISKREPLNGLISADNTLQFGVNIERNSVDKIARAVAMDTPEAVMKILRHPDVLLDCNIYSVIFDWRNNTIYLASGQVPAALGKYRKYPLFLKTENN